ncbi:hypothetical protein LAZ67_X002390 [Cordylochernes scorpioides]|uniref:Integrase catalytic domain-containing protein n=1 Tax=Cordylochernes scorpioides TaxID=51811 RepID=A0ABY6LTL1_9ARAC|nr:hypothetical protein LAZ67_X002390 [Cordylochernes scorpioides]
MTQKLSRWVPHELREWQQERRLVTCEGLLTRHEKKSFLHRIVTSDEKWIHFSNPTCQKSWALPSQFPKQMLRPNRFGKINALCMVGSDRHSIFRAPETWRNDPPGEESERQKWKIKDSQAKGIITCAMTDSQVSLILTCKTSKQIWASLTKMYEGDIKKKSIEARNNVSCLRMYPEESWKDNLHRSEKLLENARIMGATICDEEFIYSVIKGLPQKYNIIAVQINTMNNPTLLDIKSQFSLYQERGHKANDCLHNPKNKGNNNRREDLNKPSTSGYKPKFGNQQKQTGNSHNEKAANCLIAKNKEKSEQEWIIDSGATSHMTSCFELLKDSENKERKIIIADDTQIESKAIGNVKIKTKEENLLILKDVLFVPQIKGNLLSVGKLVPDYQRIIFSKDKYDYSRKLFTRFLKAKSETQEILKEFIEYIENTNNKRIKKFRSDNGTEFNNQELESYLKKKGIEHQRTTFFSLAQNGRCERANRSLIEGTRALLLEYGSPIKLWAEAMNTYTYLKNRTPSYHNTNKTPEEMFTGRKPSLSLKETRDVAFLENQKGAELLTSNEQDSTDYSIIKIDGPAEEETNSSSGDE